MKLTIHRGTEEIGGSCVELSTERARLLFDAGLPLPSLDGGKRPVPQLPPSLDLDGNLGRPLDACFLSHAHGDHVGLVPLLPDDVPVCLGRITSKLLLAGGVYAKGAGLGSRRRETLEDWRPVAYGDLRVTPVPVDHSAPGAFAFLIETAERRLLYSGDLRWHGPKPQLLDRMVARLGGEPLDALVMEGTSLGSAARESVSEEDLVEQIARRMNSEDRLALLFFSPQNTDRLLTMIDAAKRARRTLVLDAYSLFVLYLMKSERGMPNPFDGTLPIRVWFPDGQLPDGTGPFKSVSEQARALAIHLDEFLVEPGGYALVFRGWMAERYPEIVARSGVAVWSYWAGYERAARTAELRRALESAGVEWIHAHASGHILATDSRRLVDALNPKTLIPIHTEQADRFHEFFPGRSVTRLRDGVEMEI